MALPRSARATVTIPIGCRDHVVPMSDDRVRPLSDMGVRQVTMSHLIAGFEWPGPEPQSHMILATVHGVGQLEVNGERHRLSSGSVAVCPAGVPRWHGAEEPWDVVTIRLAPSEASSALDSADPYVIDDRDPYLLAAPTLGMLAELPAGDTAVSMPSSGLVPMRTFLRRFGDRLPQSAVGDAVRAPTDPLSLYALALRMQLERLVASSPVSGDSERLLGLWEAVRRWPGRDWSVPQLAAHVGVSRATLHRQVERCHGSTPGAIVEDIRMEHAARLLAHGDLPVKAVAAQVGYATPYSFSAAFSRARGCPPSEYRERSAPAG